MHSFCTLRQGKAFGQRTFSYASPVICTSGHTGKFGPSQEKNQDAALFADPFCSKKKRLW